VNERTVIVLSAIVGAVVGGAAGFLLLTERGRAIARELEPRVGRAGARPRALQRTASGRRRQPRRAGARCTMRPLDQQWTEPGRPGVGASGRSDVRRGPVRVISRGGRMAEFERDEHEHGGGFMMGLLTGTVLGAGLGMLLAPKSGREMRHDIGEQASSLGRAAGEQFRRAADAASGLHRQAREAAARSGAAETRGPRASGPGSDESASRDRDGRQREPGACRGQHLHREHGALLT
jgi:gas vesicle protein